MAGLGIGFYRNVDINMKGVVLNADGRGLGKTQDNGGVNFFQRLFNTSSRQQLSKNLLADFKASLTRTYGEDVARRAIRGTFGGDVLNALENRGTAEIAKVSGRQILDALARADRCVLAGGEETPARRKVKKAVILEMLRTQPLHGAERDSLLARIDLALRGLTGNDDETRGLQLKLRERQRELRDMPLDTLTTGQVRKAVETWLTAARNALLARVRQFDNRSAVMQEFDNRASALRHRLYDVPAEHPFVFGKATLSKDTLKNICGHVTGFAKAAVSSVGCKVDLTGLQDDIRQRRTTAMNKDPSAWKRVVKKISTSLVVNGAGANGKKTMKLQIVSSQNPASKIVGLTADYRRDGIRGVICHDNGQASHATNLWQTSQTLSVGLRQKKTVFEGLRHGVHSAYKLPSGSDARRTANVNHAAETVKAAFLTRPSLLDRARGIPDGGVLEFPMTSISLMTPIGYSGENAMLADQNEAWRTVARDGVRITVEGKTITLKPKIVTFSLGVNKGATKFYSVIPAIGGWDTSGAMNQEALRELRRRVVNFATEQAGNRDPEAVRRVALAGKLLRQIEGLFAAEAERNAKGSAFKVASRIAVLSYLMGDPPCFNCKSGKDRTGVMDAECKYLATVIETTGDVPDPYATRSPSEQKLFRELLLEGGGREVQRANVGFAGFKNSTDVSTTLANAGGSQYKRAIDGSSSLVGG